MDFGSTSGISSSLAGHQIVSRRDKFVFSSERGENFRSLKTISRLRRSYADVGLVEGLTERHILMTVHKSSLYFEGISGYTPVVTFW